jgi:hypothetical protein
MKLSWGPSKHSAVKNLKPNLCGGTAKKITSSLHKKIVEETQKNKIKQATKSRTKQFVLNARVGPSKGLKRRVRWDATPSDSTPDSDTELAVTVADDSTEVDDEQDADCLYCTGRSSGDHNGEDWIRCQKCFSWAHALCAGIEEDFVCEPCQGYTLCGSQFVPFVFVIFNIL